MFTDNKDFYPTPKELFYKLMNGKRYLAGRILEPSAGKGDLIKYIRELPRHNKSRIDAIEKDERLAGLLMSEGITVVWDDFLTYQTYKEYDYIIMNPPFSNGVDHVLKALELAENQLGYCEIYAILNKETINNAFSAKRQELLRKLDEHGAEIRYVKDGFIDAERKTDVEVALITAKIQKRGAGKSIYDKIPFNTTQANTDELSTALSTYVKQSEVQAKLNDIERLVLEYETACELARKTFEAIRDKESFFSYIGTVNKRDGEVGSPFSYVVSNNFTVADLSEEIDRLRRGYWQLILDTDEFKKMLTNEAIQELNKRLGAAEQMEINLPNIRMLLMAISFNKRDMLVESVVSIFKKITQYHQNQYSTNIHYYNGWKTNDAYKINKKIVIPIKWSNFDPAWDFDKDFGRINRDARDFILDLIKALQLIEPSVSEEFKTISEQEFENDTLRFRMFKNGNIHVWFKDLTLLSQLNYLCGSHFDWLPSEEELKTDRKAREYVVKEFGEDAMKVTLIGA
ncbi:DUF4942 domain-containing protein [Lederbergia citri]|uniref:DUF4942 domain-containing protein n=1 Tax=Lederbergia citri TaxID=2833580 RepID=A0A942YGA9_9BACI|nr:DUF4942 domain-containing protein [Lederbergia citri]MBS4195347.1 DUF4942 domain-containing protein [Lederbergia citri]